jgi:hypothetical protein
LGLSELIRLTPVYRTPIYTEEQLREARLRAIQRKSSYGVGPDMFKDMWKTPADPKILARIRNEHKLAKEQMPGGLRRDRQYGSTRSQMKNFVPNMMGRIKRQKSEYRGVMKGMPARIEKGPIDFKIGHKNDIRF